ncbi:hypothetical protein BN970_05515 [Mycolicibacterium conceptionense]|uniref:Uncharacterized protein n=1 Tax=Mycolicibacterium conceptionense TaxID=451644 RepID=A0A0U1DU96_9MYCO|nr:hypothetical protein BN970_05515 [Mycolicibacterium conceptionense]
MAESGDLGAVAASLATDSASSARSVLKTPKITWPLNSATTSPVSTVSAAGR